MSFLVLPFFQEYMDSGEFENRARGRDSVRVNLTIYFYAILLVLFIWVAFLTSGKLFLRDTPDFMAALANCFGLTIIVLLMGYGLVQVPKELYAGQGISNEGKAYQEMYEIDETRIDLEFDLEALSQEIIYA